jgi:hypothetical protein
MAYSKDLFQYIKELQRQGWTAEATRKHIHLRAPWGQLFTCSSTPRCPFAVNHLKADIKRYSSKTPLFSRAQGSNPVKDFDRTKNS